MDDRFEDDRVELIGKSGLFTEIGDGERRLALVERDGVDNVFGKTSGSYSGIGSI